MHLRRLIGAAMVSLVPALFAAAVVGRLIGGAPQLVPLGTEDIGEGVRIGKYFVYPGFGGTVFFWVLVIVVFAIAGIASMPLPASYGALAAFTILLAVAMLILVLPSLLILVTRLTVMGRRNIQKRANGRHGKETCLQGNNPAQPFPNLA